MQDNTSEIENQSAPVQTQQKEPTYNQKYNMIRNEFTGMRRMFEAFLPDKKYITVNKQGRSYFYSVKKETADHNRERARLRYWEKKNAKLNPQSPTPSPEIEIVETTEPVICPNCGK